MDPSLAASEEVQACVKALRAVSASATAASTPVANQDVHVTMSSTADAAASTSSSSPSPAPSSNKNPVEMSTHSPSPPLNVFVSAWSDIYARIRALHSLSPSLWDPVSSSGKVKLQTDMLPYPDAADFASSAAAEAWREKHLSVLESAYKALLECCGERPMLFVHVIQAQTEGVAGACVRLFLHVYNKGAIEAEARLDSSAATPGCFCIRRFTGREISAHDHDCYGSDFIILPSSSSNVPSSPSHPLFHTSMLLPLASTEDKITFDLHNNLCCVPWSWQAVNHVTAFASKQVHVGKLARKQHDPNVLIQDPQAAAAAALKGLRDANGDAASAAAAAATVPLDSLNAWGLGLVEYQWIKCKDITRLTKGQVLIGSCILPPKSIRDQGESLQKTHGLPGDSRAIIETLVQNLVYAIGAQSACASVHRVLSTVASWLGCSEAAPLCMLLHVTAAYVRDGNITAEHALSRMCSLLNASCFDAADAAHLPSKEHQLVSIMWSGICDMFETLTHRQHELEFSLFHSKTDAAHAKTDPTWLDNVVELIKFYQSMSASTSHSSQRLQSPSATANVHPSLSSGGGFFVHPPVSTLAPEVTRILDYIEQSLTTYTSQLEKRLLESSAPFPHSVGDRTITIPKETCFACCYCDSLASILDENLALSLNTVSNSFPSLIPYIHKWALIIMLFATNAAHPPAFSKSPAFVDSEYSFPWFVTSFSRILSFFKHSAFKGESYSGNIELIDLKKNVEDRIIASARVWIEKYVHATMIERVRRIIDTDDWCDKGTGNSMGVWLLVSDVCAHVANFAEILSKITLPESVTVSLCSRLVVVMFSAIKQYTKQLQRPLRDILRQNASIITNRSSSSSNVVETDGKSLRDMLTSTSSKSAEAETTSNALGEVITPEVMAILHNFLYLRSRLDYIVDQIALTCLRHASRQSFVDSHQEDLCQVQAKLQLQLSGALLMVTDAAAKFCLEPACTAALMDAGDMDDRGEAGDQESAVLEFNEVLAAVKDFTYQAAGSLDSAQSRQLKSLLGNSLQRATITFLEDVVFSTSFEPKMGSDGIDKLRRMCCLVLRSSNAEFICKEKTPLLLDGSEDTRLQGGSFSIFVCFFVCLFVFFILRVCFYSRSWTHLCDAFGPELKNNDLQGIMAWSLEDAIANYETSKQSIESEAENAEGATGDGDVTALKYLIEVYKYCVNIATTKQVRRVRRLHSIMRPDAGT
jgi:hypothetical protein